jgi:hypothetical protein
LKHFHQINYKQEISLQYSGSKTANINIKNCKAFLEKIVIGRAVTALKQEKSKGKGDFDFCCFRAVTLIQRCLSKTTPFFFTFNFCCCFAVSFRFYDF